MKLFAFLWLATYMTGLAIFSLSDSTAQFDCWGFVGIAFVIAVSAYALLLVNQRCIREIRISQLKGDK
ncbi:hypothetical protein [Siccibacter colletis]|uniref:hypothetical protein n=1 Tax=Siccibacter colletis TaxID=1505757 RepID=UPI003CF93D34